MKEVTVYAFSLENFKRSATEIDDLLALFEHKLTQLLDESLVFRCGYHKKSLKSFVVEYTSFAESIISVIDIDEKIL